MTQQKLDDLFSQTPSHKRSRITQRPTNDRDEFDDLFETNSSIKRRRTNNKQSIDVLDFDLDLPSTSTKKKRSIIDDDQNKAIDDLFNNDTRKKLRRPIKKEDSDDLLDMFQTRTNTNNPQTISTLDDFKTPISSKTSTTQKKIKMFFDDTDLISLREQEDTKDYIHIKPILITSGQWLSKEAETKVIALQSSDVDGNMKSSDNLIDIPDDERNLMHIQYAPLIIDEETVNTKKSKNNSVTRKSSKKLLDGKSFQKQLVVSDSTIFRKENLQSCYNALLEDINKPRISSSNKSTKSTTSKFSNDDEEQIDNIDFFDLPSRKKKF